MLELLKTDQLIIRSIFHALRKHVIDHGYFPDVNEYGDTDTDVTLYQEHLKHIQKTKGFYIETFSESSARNKRSKDAPRIVVSLDRTYSGEIGAPPSQLFKVGKDRWRSGSLPGRSANINISVALISHNSEQHYTLNSIKDNVLGERGFLPLYNDKTAAPFFIQQISYMDMDDPADNITERVYVYQVPDLFLGDNRVIRDNIVPINQIDVDIKDNPSDHLQVKE